MACDFVVSPVLQVSEHQPQNGSAFQELALRVLLSFLFELPALGPQIK